MVNEVAAGLPRTPHVAFSGPVDLAVTGGLADDAVAVIRESLTNVVKHASAQQTSVSVAVVHGTVIIEITDDGIGATPGLRRSGLANLEARARTYGGEFTFESEPGNTRSRWRAPYTDQAEEAEL